MKARIITALFDISRGTKGDGRTIENYLTWFKDTLKLNCDTTIYCEPKFVNFVRENRKKISFNTEIIERKLEEIPLFGRKNEIQEILDSKEYKEKMSDTNRIECKLPEYNILMYSKFEWLEEAGRSHSENDTLIWMDAGVSRFFDNFDFSNEWPKIRNINSSKFNIQGNSNFEKKLLDRREETCIWDNNSCLVGTLFVATLPIITKIKNEISNIFEEMINKKAINNEQIALGILYKRIPELFNVYIELNGKHLPFFKYLSE